MGLFASVFCVKKLDLQGSSVDFLPVTAKVVRDLSLVTQGKGVKGYTENKKIFNKLNAKVTFGLKESFRFCESKSYSTLMHQSKCTGCKIYF